MDITWINFIRISTANNFEIVVILMKKNYSGGLYLWHPPSDGCHSVVLNKHSSLQRDTSYASVFSALSPLLCTVYYAPFIMYRLLCTVYCVSVCHRDHILVRGSHGLAQLYQYRVEIAESVCYRELKEYLASEYRCYRINFWIYISIDPDEISYWTENSNAATHPPLIRTQ